MSIGLQHLINQAVSPQLVYTAFNVATPSWIQLINQISHQEQVKLCQRQGTVETIQCYSKAKPNPHVIQKQLAELKQHATVL